MKDIKRCFCKLLVLCFAIGCVSGCSKHTSSITSETKQVMTVGVDVYPPYSYLDENGVFTGIDVELATKSFQRLGYDVNFKQIDWELKKDLVENGDIDCIWSSFSMEGRLEDYQWAGPYMVSQQVIAVRSDSDIYSLQDLEGKTVAVQSTTKPETILLKYENMPKLENLISLENRELLYTFLEKGYVDAVGAHKTSILQYMKDYNTTYRFLDEPLAIVGIGVAFSKYDERNISKKLDEVLEEMRKDGTSEKIIGKYLDDASSYLEVDQLDY